MKLTLNSRLLPLMAALGLCFSLLGCSSAHKRATELMEGEAYGDAIQAYEGILREDPTDSKAKVGLIQARTKWIDRQLIEVRLTRLSGNQTHSLHLLNGIFQEEKEWQMFPQGAVAFTQNEETDFATRELTQLINEALRQNLPLRANWLTRFDSFVFDRIPPLQRDLLALDTVKLGASECGRLRKSATASPFYGEFINKYCAHFDVGLPPAGNRNFSAKVAAELIKNVEFDSQIPALPSVMKAQFEADLNSAFRQTAWFDAGSSKSAKLQAAGSFAFDRQASPQTLYHNYTVEIPYTAYETVYKTREVPYQDTQYVFNGLTQKYESQSVTRTRTESYSEQQPVTRTRTEPRVFTFEGQKFSERIRLELATRFELDPDKNVELRSAFQKEFDQSEDVHDVSMPQIGLHPQPLSLPEQDAWLGLQSKEFAQKIGNELAQKWVASFCENSERNLKQNTEQELVFKCLRQPLTSYPIFAQTWFQTHLGLDIVEANRLVGFLRN